MAIINTKIYDQKVKVQKIRTTSIKGNDRGKEMSIAGILLFIIWVSFVVLGMLGYLFKTLDEYRIENIELDEMDRDNIN